MGIACLRAAMGDVQRKRGFADEALARNMAPERFAYISDSTYTAAEVVDMTAIIQNCTPDDLRTSPNSKMFLRSFWYRLVQASAVSSEEMHIYTLSRYGHVPLEIALSGLLLQVSGRVESDRKATY